MQVVMSNTSERVSAPLTGVVNARAFGLGLAYSVSVYWTHSQSGSLASRQGGVKAYQTTLPCIYEIPQAAD